MNKIIPTLTLGSFLSLIGPKNVDAQNIRTIDQNRIMSSENHYSVAGDAIVLKNNAFKINLNPESDIDLSESFGFFAKKGNIDYRIISPRQGTEKVIRNLESRLRNTRDTDSRKIINSEISWYKRILRGLPEDCQESISLLNNAVLDGKINSIQDNLIEGNEWKISPGTYMAIARSQEINGLEPNSIPIYLKLNTSEIQEDSEIVEEVSEERAPQKEVVRGKNIIIHLLKDEKDEKRAPINFIADLIVLEDKINGGQVGFGYGPFSLNVGYNTRQDITTTVQQELSRGRIGGGTERIQNISEYSACFEFNPIKYVTLGVGPVFRNETLNLEETIHSSQGDLLSENKNSKNRSEVYARFHGGLNIPLGRDNYIRVGAGTDSKKELYFKVGASVNLNKGSNSGRKNNLRAR